MQFSNFQPKQTKDNPKLVCQPFGLQENNCVVVEGSTTQR